METKKEKIYFLGIGGTGMASVAGLLKIAGYQVTGSDKELYPPMSTMLEELEIGVLKPYNIENLKRASPTLVVVANSLSRGNVEIEYVLENKIPYTSFPKLLHDFFLQRQRAIVVSGTHGKTTTTSLVAHLLTELGEAPSFLIGGMPKNFPNSFNLGPGKFFVIEGDEYDTAFFDKGPKFLHYNPKILLINCIEFDHADIYQSVEAIEKQFEALVKLVPSPSRLVVNIDDDRTANLLSCLHVLKDSVKVSPFKQNKNAEVVVEKVVQHPKDLSKWQALIRTKSFGSLPVDINMVGKYNVANVAQAIGCICALKENGELKGDVSPEGLSTAVASFLGVKRRLELLGSFDGVEIFEDFAHHPTAVGLVIATLREKFPGQRLLVAFEPRNATSRRNVFQKEYTKVLSEPDLVFIGNCPVDERIPSHLRMNTLDIASAVGHKAKAFSDNDELLKAILSTLRQNDVLVFMSSSSFSGVQHKIIERLSKPTENIDKKLR